MIKKLIRTLQTFFPKMREFKFYIQRALRAATKKPFEVDFEVLGSLGNKVKLTQFLDVGANRGQSIDAIRMYFPCVDLIAFEPDKLLYEKLVSRYSNDKHVKLNNFGLGEECGGFTLHTPVYNGWAFDGLASFERGCAEEWLNSGTIFMFDPAKLQIQTQLCDVRTLDSLMLSPSFIKIDVQGLERSVLKGGVETLKRCKPIILLETGEDDELLNAAMANLGYVTAGYDGKVLRRGSSCTQNTFYIHETRISELCQ